MLLALGAASSAIDALQALTSSKSSSANRRGSARTSQSVRLLRRARQRSTSVEPRAGGGGGSQISPETMSALLGGAKPVLDGHDVLDADQPSDALKDLFSQIDADGDGKITKSEFENALGAGGTNLAQADDVFAKLDKDGDGSVSLDEMSSALKGGKGHHHHHHMAGGAPATGGSNSDPLMQALQGASSTSVTNSDGSTTTSLTYADGSKVTMTSAGAAAVRRAPRRRPTISSSR